MGISTTDGQELALELNEKTGKMRLTWSDGDVAFDDGMKETVLSLLIEEEGPFTTGRRRGPGIRSVSVDNSDTPSLLKARAEERLQLAVDDGRLRSVMVTVIKQTRGFPKVRVDYVTRSGRRDFVVAQAGH